jgi:hypothetical protein
MMMMMMIHTDEIDCLEPAWQCAHVDGSGELELSIVSLAKQRRINDSTLKSSKARVGSNKIILLLILKTSEPAKMAQCSDRKAVCEDCCDSRRPDVAKIPLDPVVLIVRVVEHGLLLGSHAGTGGCYSGRKGDEQQWHVHR